MNPHVDIDMTDLTPPPSGSRPDMTLFAGLQLLGALASDRARLRMPLALFYSPSIRTEIEHQLAARDLQPQWDRAKTLVDARGTLIRFVSITRIACVRSHHGAHATSTHAVRSS